MRRPIVAVAGPLVVILLVGAWLFVGIYTVQPIGALPEGITLVVWRASNEPFFNSADGTCLRIQGSLSLLCRTLAMAAAKPPERIIMRLPYGEMAYLWSTGGRAFERWPSRKCAPRSYNATLSK